MAIRDVHHFNSIDSMKTKSPLVSMIIPVYGVEKYISECAHSLFSQTYDNIECIFVNDCTEDRSMEVLQEIIDLYPGRKPFCRIISHKQNLGLAGARCTGISYAEGEYIMHVDSDDYLELNAVELLVEKAQASKADIVVGGFYRTFDSRHRTRVLPEHLEKDEYICRILNMSVYTNVWGKLYSSVLYSDGYDTMPVIGINHGEDFVTLPRLLYYSEKIAYLDAPVYNYVVYNANSYTRNFNEKSMDNLVEANRVLHDFFADKIESDVLELALLRTQLAMYKYCNIKLFPDIKALYPTDLMKHKDKLSWADRILIYLIDHGMYDLAVIYMKAGLKLLSYVR